MFFLFVENYGSKVKPPKQGPFQSKQGSTMGSRFTQIIVYIYIYTYMLIHIQRSNMFHIYRTPT